MIRRLLAAVALIGSIGGVHADTPTPVNLNFPASDGMTVTDCLKAVAMQTGAVVLPDATVSGTVGDIHVTKNSVPEMLDYLKTYEPGLTWQAVYYPANANEPSGEDLFRAVTELQALPLDGLIVPPAGDDKTMLTFKKQLYTTAQQEATNESGFKIYYLVSDPSQRAQIDKASKFQATMNDLVAQVNAMTAPQKSAALTALNAALHQTIQTNGH